MGTGRAHQSTSSTAFWAGRLLLMALAVFVVTHAVWAYPKPRTVPTRWELEFVPGVLRLYTDVSSGRSYWYFTYEVVNTTGEDQLWFPSFTLYTDGGEILDSGDDVPYSITRKIRDYVGSDYMLVHSDVIGTLRQGRGHAREGLVIWPANQLDLTELSLFIGGISGERATVVNPLNGDRISLQKTMQRNYLVPGNLVPRSDRPIELDPDNPEQWIFR